MISESIENINNKMMLQKIRESQETLTSMSCKIHSQGLFDQLNFIEKDPLDAEREHFQSMTSNTIENIRSKLQKKETQQSDKDGKQFLFDFENKSSEYYPQFSSANEILNFFNQLTSGQQKTSNFKSSNTNNVANDVQEMNESNCSTNLLTSSIKFYNQHQYKKQFSENDQNPQLKKQETIQPTQYEENKDFDLFSFIPLKMRNLKSERQQKQENDEQEDKKLLIKELNLQILNQVVEQAESIVIDLSDREDDFSQECIISHPLKFDNIHLELPQIAQPCQLEQNQQLLDNLLSHDFDISHISQNISNISQQSLGDHIIKCHSGNNLNVQNKEIPSLKRQSSEPLTQSIYKDKLISSNSSISQFSQKSSNKKTIQRCKIDKKQNKKNQNQEIISSSLPIQNEKTAESSIIKSENQLCCRIGKQFAKYLKLKRDSCLLKSDKKGALLYKQYKELFKNTFNNLKQKQNFDNFLQEQYEENNIEGLQAQFLEFLDSKIENCKIEEGNQVQVSVLEFQKIKDQFLKQKSSSIKSPKNK